MFSACSSTLRHFSASRSYRKMFSKKACTGVLTVAGCGRFKFVSEKPGNRPAAEYIYTLFFYENNFIRTTRLKYGQRLRTT